MTWQPDTYHVVTNHHPRPVLDWHDLTDEERDDLGYDGDGNTFFRYRGSIYDLNEFEAAPDRIKALGWDGHQTQSYFDTVAVRWFDEDGNYLGYDEVVVAHIHW